MNRKQLIFVLLALAVIGSAGLILLKRNNQLWTSRGTKMGDKVLPNFPFNEVAAIHIKGRSELNVVRKNGLWCVPERGDYAANPDLVRDVVMRMRDAKIVHSESIGPSQLARVELDEPGKENGGGTLLEFKDAQGKLLAAVLAGKKHDRPQNENEPLGLRGFFDGRYILLPSDPRNVLLISDELAGAMADPGSWLSMDFFKVEHIKFISLISSNPTNSWELSRETESSPWVLANSRPGEMLDAKIASQTAEILAFPRFVDVIPRAAPSETGLDKPTVVTVVTEDQLAYTLKVSAKGPDGNYRMMVAVAADIPTERVADKGEQPDEKQRLDKEFQDKTKQLREKVAKESRLFGGPWVYVVDSWIELVIRDRAQLLEKKALATAQDAGQ